MLPEMKFSVDVSFQLQTPMKVFPELQLRAQLIFKTQWVKVTAPE